jgi:hypothetical protein
VIRSQNHHLGERGKCKYGEHGDIHGGNRGGLQAWGKSPTLQSDDSGISINHCEMGEGVNPSGVRKSITFSSGHNGETFQDWFG